MRPLGLIDFERVVIVPTLLMAIVLILAAGAPAQAAEPIPSIQPPEDRPLAIPNAGEIIGLNVINPDGRDLGRVDDLVIGEDGRIDYVVIRRGGFLGFFRRRVAVPWAASAPHVQENVLILDLSPERLDGAPAFKGWEAFRTGDYPERVRAYFGVEPNAETGRPVEGASAPPPPGGIPRPQPPPEK